MYSYVFDNDNVLFSFNLIDMCRRYNMFDIGLGSGDIKMTFI